MDDEQFTSASVSAGDSDWGRKFQGFIGYFLDQEVGAPAYRYFSRIIGITASNRKTVEQPMRNRAWCGPLWGFHFLSVHVPNRTRGRADRRSNGLRQQFLKHPTGVHSGGLGSLKTEATEYDIKVNYLNWGSTFKRWHCCAPRDLTRAALPAGNRRLHRGELVDELNGARAGSQNTVGAGGLQVRLSSSNSTGGDEPWERDLLDTHRPP